MLIRVWRFNDSSSTNEILAYGVAPLPKQPGYTRIECQTWTAFGDWKYQTLGFYLGTQARLNSASSLSSEAEDRRRLFSEGSGTVVLEVEVLARSLSAS